MEPNQPERPETTPKGLPQSRAEEKSCAETQCGSFNVLIPRTPLQRGAGACTRQDGLKRLLNVGGVQR